MLDQDRSCDTSDTARNRSDRIHNRFCVGEVDVTTELAFLVYVDADIDDSLTGAQVVCANDTWSSGGNDHDVCFFYNGWHICSFRVTDSYGCIFLKQHHGGWFSNDGTSADHDSFFAGAVDAIVI